MRRISTIVLCLLVAACAKESDNSTQSGSVHMYSVPRFSDPASFQRLKEFFPVVDSIYKNYARERHFPSIAYGVVVSDQLVHSGAAGFTNAASKSKANNKTLFRIASMSKSFTAMAILKLRDEGKLSLSDPVSKYITAMKHAGALTTDGAAITIQNLMTMSAGFPEDNPWGDRQLEDTDQELIDLVEQGISFSNVSGITFEYSNLGFALLGRIITEVSGRPYQEYITENIMKPIGMNDSRWEFDQVPAEQLAQGYQWIDDKWEPIPLLHDGAYGAMGGLICSIEDFSKYISLHLNAWPPRNEPEEGPVRRSTIREMHQPWRFNNLFSDAKNRQGEMCPVVTGYGYGLGWRRDCKGIVRVSHSGGLPGFGSEWRIYPEYGIGVVSFSNHTYGAPSPANALALDTLISLAGLKPRVLEPSEILNRRKAEIVKLLPSWNQEGLNIFAENFFPDESLERRKAYTEKIFNEAGAIKNVGALIPENQLRGSFVLEGEMKDVTIFFTLTPEKAALIQQLEIALVDR